MSEREYIVTERMRTEQIYYVLASSRQEAIDRATAEDCLWVERGDVVPVRPLRTSDARLVRNPRSAP